MIEDAKFPAHLDALKLREPVKVGAPRDRQLVVAAHEMAVNELKDHGYPYHEGGYARGRRYRREAGDDYLHRRARDTCRFGPIEIVGDKK